MENEITINNIKYFSEVAYNNLMKELFDTEAKLVANSVKQEFKTTEFMITDPANVLAIIPFKRNEIKEDNFIITVPGLSKFEKFHDEIIFKGKFMKPEKFILRDSVYSIEMLNIAIRTAKAFNKCSNPEFYLWVNDKEEYEKDKPVLIKFDNLIFCLAPRISESEDLGEEKC